MKGIIFTSFVEFTEQKFGMEFVDKMLDLKANTTGGAYTAVGTYPSAELLDMVVYACEKKGIDVAETSIEFGKFTFGILVERYTHLVSEYQSAIDCLYHVDQTIHKNVQKLYPDAELPSMHAVLNTASTILELNYHSTRPLMYVAYGLIQGCVKHYGDSVTIEMTDLSNGVGNRAHFKLMLHV